MGDAVGISEFRSVFMSSKELSCAYESNKEFDKIKFSKEKISARKSL